MKYLLSTTMLCLFLFLTVGCNAQTDKSKRASPPAVVKQKVGDVNISIDYSQPSIKGRTIGVDLEPKAGQVWRTGANEATVFEVDRDVKVEGKPLPKGKYGLFTLVNEGEWTIIFNKTWKQWGAFEYQDSDDALRVSVKETKTDKFHEQMTFTIDPSGLVSLLWADKKVSFMVN